MFYEVYISINYYLHVYHWNFSPLFQQRIVEIPPRLRRTGNVFANYLPVISRACYIQSEDDIYRA